MVIQLTKETELDKFPNYLMIVTSHKLNRYLNSPFKWWKRYLLESNDIHLMDENLKLNNILFHNNDKKYNTIYKKMRINDKFIYIPIEEYSRFYLDHKVKISTSIVEMLGVFSIDYNYNELAIKFFTISSSGNYNNASIDGKITNEKQNHIKNNDFKIYNQSNCPYLFLKTSVFEEKIKNKNSYFMDKEEYDNDFDIQNLVRSRLEANLSEYTLKYEIEYMNNFEISLASKFYVDFGIDIKKNDQKKINVSININFFRKRDLINSENMDINNYCLQLILKGPSPDNYYESLLESVKIKKNDQSTSEKYDIVKLRLNKNNNTNYILLFNFIEKYIQSKYKYSNDNDDYESYYSYYNFIKIAQEETLKQYMSEVRNLDDLDKNGIFFLRLRSTGFASLLSFDEKGFNKLQKIYLNIYRQYSDIEKLNESNSLHLKRIYIYMIRLYNNVCSPDQIIIFDKDIDETLTKILFNILINIVIIPDFNIFQKYVITEINKYKHQQLLNIYKKDNLSLLV